MPMELWNSAEGVICSVWSRSYGKGFKERGGVGAEPYRIL